MWPRCWSVLPGSCLIRRWQRLSVEVRLVNELGAPAGERTELHHVEFRIIVRAGWIQDQRLEEWPSLFLDHVE